MSDQKKKNHEANPEPMCRNISRRNFLKGIGTGAVASVVAPAILPLGGCVPTPGGCDGGPTGVLQLSKPSPPIGTAKVSIVQNGSIEDQVRAAIELAGGLDEISQGDKVIIKPNLTSADPGVATAGRITTSPQVIRAVIRAVSERTAASNIDVSDASAFGGPTQQYARSTGLLSAVNAEGANFVAWNTGPYTRVQSRDARYLNWAFRVPTSIATGHYQHFINVPILKNHEMVPQANVEYTCCIKAHVGVLHPTDRLSGGGRGIHTANLGEIAAELSLVAPVKTMNVVDALTCVLQGGPSTPLSPNFSARPGLILASKDQVAADSLSLAVLKYYAKKHGINRPYTRKPVWEQASIKRAQELNLGRSKNNIQVVNGGVDIFNDLMEYWEEV